MYRIMTEDYFLQIQAIKKRLRLAMNGVVSTSMRDRGLDYKLNFGVALPTLRKMGEGYGKNHDLAQLLWCENVRELKILATLIQPAESFTKEIAGEWVKSINSPEMAEQCSMNLFQHLTFAREISLKWLGESEELIRYTAWHLLARVAFKGELFSEADLNVILTEAVKDLQSNQLNLFNGALLALKRVGVKNKQIAESILTEIQHNSLMDRDKKLQIYDDLRFEFDYYLQTPL